MSNRVMGKIWDLDLAHQEMLILLALADHADHNGEHIYPGVELLAWKTGYSERQVQRVLKQLEESGMLVASKRGIGRGNLTEYAIDCDKGKRKPDFGEKGDKMTPYKRNKGRQNVTIKSDKAGQNVTLSSDKGCQNVTDSTQERVTFTTLKGDIPGFPLSLPPLASPSSLIPSGNRPESKEVSPSEITAPVEILPAAVTAPPVKTLLKVPKKDWSQRENWPADAQFLFDALATQDILDITALGLWDQPWWDATSYAAGGLNALIIEEEFGKMKAWCLEKPRRIPRSSTGWKRFLRTWFEKSATYRRREEQYGQAIQRRQSYRY